MTAQPQWSPLDDETSDLLSLVADGPMSGSADHEWDVFVAALRDSAFHVRPWSARSKNTLTDAGPFIIDPNNLRLLVRDRIAPRRIGAFTNRALSQGLIAYTGEWVVSDDTTGRNAGKPCRVMRWTGGQL